MKKSAIALAASAVLALALSACSGATDTAEVTSTGTGTSKPAAAKAEAPKNESKIVLEVTSDAPTLGSVTYTAFKDGQMGQEQAQGVAAPFKKETTAKKDKFAFNSLSVIGQAADGATKISCKITVDGVVKAEQTSTGAYSVVTCSAS